MKKSIITATLIAVLATVWVLSGMMADKGDATQAPQAILQAQEDAVFKVRVKTLKAQSYTQSINVTGRSRASRNVHLSAELNGKVEKINYREGANVIGGEVIAVLDKRDRKARVTEAKFRLKQKELEYNAAESLETRGFNSRIRLAQAKADLEQAQADLEQAQKDYENTEILAPFDAVIFERQIEEGDFASTGQELFHLVDLDPMQIIASVTEQEVQGIKVGAVVKVAFLDGDMHEGTVTYVAPASDEATRTFEVKMELPNPANKLRQGLTAKVTIPLDTYSAYKISPSVLSLNDDGDLGVKLVDAENKAAFYPVRVLSDYPKYMWVDGLPEQINLITVGQDFVQDGQEVEVITSTEDGLL